MQISILEKVSINDSNQWLLTRGNADKPLILQIQAGPGLPMISEADTLQKLLHLEDDFLVAYWDQRGCGKSFDKKENSAHINLEQLTDDVISCARYLLKRYGKQKLHLVGYSMGATISLLATQKAPGLFSNIFSVGPDINVPAANNFAIEFLVGKAEKQTTKKWLKQINQLRGVEIDSAKLFKKRAKLVSDAGGIISHMNYNDIFFATLKNMLFSKDYTMSDIIRTVRGIEFCQNALLPEFNRLNIFQKINTVRLPVHFVQGVKDAVAPLHIAREYFQFLNCTSKTFTEFNQSAHMPHLEEPTKFAELIRAKVNGTT